MSILFINSVCIETIASARLCVNMRIIIITRSAYTECTNRFVLSRCLRLALRAARHPSRQVQCPVHQFLHTCGFTQTNIRCWHDQCTLDVEMRAHAGRTNVFYVLFEIPMRSFYDPLELVRPTVVRVTRNLREAAGIWTIQDTNGIVTRRRSCV